MNLLLKTQGIKMIKFLDLKKINERYEQEFEAVYRDVVNSGWYISGNMLSKFEKEFASYCDTRYCVGVANGLDAIVLILKAFIQQGRLRTGDEVLVPANTFIATILAVKQVGMTPVLVEPSLETYNIDPAKIKEVITKKTKALISVHLYGQMSDLEEIEKICENEKLILIEDSAQAHGAKVAKRKAGAWGEASAFSFYPGKNLGALGDAGGITTDSEELYNILIKLRNYGSSEKYKHELVGVNSRLDELQAGFLSVKLKDLDTENETRRSIARLYLNNIKNEKIILPKIRHNEEAHVWHLFVLRVEDREKFIRHMEKNKIQVSIHYPIAPHLQDALREFSSMRLPISETIHNQVVSLPISSALTQEEVQEIIKVVNEYC